MSFWTPIFYKLSITKWQSTWVANTDEVCKISFRITLQKHSLSKYQGENAIRDRFYCMQKSTEIRRVSKDI